MSFLGKVFRSLWTAFVGLGVVLAFWLDVQGIRGELEGAVSNVLPVASALLPFIVIGVGIWVSLTIATALWKWVADFVNEGPAKRNFSKLQPRIEYCVGLLKDFDSDYYTMVDDESAKSERTSRLVQELNTLNVELGKMEIAIAPLIIKSPEDRAKLVGHLTGLGVCASYGNIHGARDLIRRQQVADK